jgi:hypothetical protein
VLRSKSIKSESGCIFPDVVIDKKKYGYISFSEMTLRFNTELEFTREFIVPASSSEI